MRYHFDKDELPGLGYGESYVCGHPVYTRCTLYKIGERGLCVIQQYFDEGAKTTRWDEVEAGVRDKIYLNDGFLAYFGERSGTADENGLYPTVTVRQIMWALRMKPLEKHRWETVFDRREI